MTPGRPQAVPTMHNIRFSHPVGAGVLTGPRTGDISPPGEDDVGAAPCGGPRPDGASGHDTYQEHPLIRHRLQRCHLPPWVGKALRAGFKGFPHRGEAVERSETDEGANDRALGGIKIPRQGQSPCPTVKHRRPPLRGVGGKPTHGGGAPGNPFMTQRQRS